jgi:hypothetical protein
MDIDTYLDSEPYFAYYILFAREATLGHFPYISRFIIFVLAIP